MHVPEVWSNFNALRTILRTGCYELFNIGIRPVQSSRLAALALQQYNRSSPRVDPVPARLISYIPFHKALNICGVFFIH